MRFIYTFFFYLVIPFVLLRLLWKSRKLPAYRHRIPERFFINSNIQGPIDVWLHAVSLGEVVAATPLIEALLQDKRRVLVTTMTPTGSAQVIKRFGASVAHCYLPYDLPGCMRRFFKKIQPRVGLIMETEIWPNLIDTAKRKHVPVWIINARLSDKAYRTYKKYTWFFAPVVQALEGILAQSEHDKERFIALGADSSKVAVMGNMKFDITWNVTSSKECHELMNRCGSRCILLAASTHNDEELQLLSRLKALKAGIPSLLLCIAPRHPERFQSVYQLSLEQGFQTGLRSQGNDLNENTDVLVLDSLGELMHFYQLSDYAFVGGSLVPIGGHNVLEPIAVDVPVFCGPYMQNSKSVCDALLEEHALTMVANVDALVEAVLFMHQHPEQKEEQKRHAKVVLMANQGCVKKLVEQVSNRYFNSC